MSGGVLDFASQADYLVALLPEAVLSLTAMAVLLVDVFDRGEGGGRSRPRVRRLALVGLVAAAACNGWLIAFEAEPGSALVAVDGFRVAANFLFLGTALLAILLAVDYLERESLEIGEFYALVLFATVGMMVLAGAQDLILLFVGLEMMSVSAYVLTAFNRQDPRSAEAGLKYFLIGAFASAFLAYGIALLYGGTGTTGLVEMAPRVVEGAGAGNLLVLGGTGLLLVGFGFKVAAVPFHMWAPDAYEGAPTPVTGFMAAGVKAAAFLALVRVLGGGLAGAETLWRGVLWWLALLTMIVPNLVALVQEDVKRMLGYSSVAHAGYVLVALVTGSELGAPAALFYLVAYTLMTLGAFAIVYLVAGKGDRRSGLSEFRGMGWRRPWLGAALLLFLLSLAGFPPTGGFVGKLFVLRAAVEGGELVLAVTLVLTTLVAYYYYLRVVWKMYFESAPEDGIFPAAPGVSFRVGASVCAAGVLLLGILPGKVIDGAGRATEDLTGGNPPVAVDVPAAPATAEAGSPAARADRVGGAGEERETAEAGGT